MMDPNAFLKRTVLVVAISVLPLAPVAYAHGGKGAGGSSGGGSSSGSGNSSSSSGTGGGHSASSSTGHSVAASKGSRSAADPSNPATTGQTAHQARIFHVVGQRGTSTGYNSQNQGTNNEDLRRKHQHLLFGVIPVY